METWGEKSVLNVPFAFGDEPLGLLVIVETETERRFTREEIELVCGIGEQAAAALHNAKVYRELEQRQRETELLNEIARKITSSLRVEDIAESDRRRAAPPGALRSRRPCAHQRARHAGQRARGPR